MYEKKANSSDVCSINDFDVNVVTVCTQYVYSEEDSAVKDVSKKNSFKLFLLSKRARGHDNFQVSRIKWWNSHQLVDFFSFNENGTHYVHNSLISSLFTINNICMYIYTSKLYCNDINGIGCKFDSYT